MNKTVYIKRILPRSQYLSAYNVLVETYWLFGFIPVYQRQILI